MTDFRALCAELADHLQPRVSKENQEVPYLIRMGGYYSQSQQLIDRARAALAQPELGAKRIDLDAIKQAIEERDDAVRQYHDLAQNMVYHGNSVSHWHCKATAYRDAIGKVWNELQAAGIACDGNKSCADGVCELAARKAPSIQPQPEPQGVRQEAILDWLRNDEAWGTIVAPKSWGAQDDKLLNLLLRAIAHFGRPTIQPVPVSERPWEREGWCDAEGRCYGWDGDYWWMVGNPGAANETITHCLPANALPTPDTTND
jgi:hypothetical protein